MEYHNTYRLRDKSGEDFSDRLEVILLELPKLPQETDGSALWDWLRFIAARTLEELKMLAEKNPEVKNAVNRLMELNADEQARMEAESRERLRLDIGSYKRDALEQGRAEGLEEGQAKGRAEANHAIARKLLERGWSADEVAATTTLSRDEVLSLAH